MTASNSKYLLTAILLGLLLPACDDPTLERSDNAGLLEAIDATQSPILYGTQDEDDPSVVGLYKVTKQEGNTYWGKIYCTGTLIHPSWILTAGHCVTDKGETAATPSDNNSKMMIFVGLTHSKGHVYAIAGANQIYWPSNYNDAIKGGNDIALIKLKEPMKSTVATPILPHPKWLPLSSQKLPVDMTVIGFGFDENGKGEVKNTITRKVEKYCGPANPSDSTLGCEAGTYHLQGCHPNESYCKEWGTFDKDVNLHMNYGTFFNSRVGGGQCNGDSGGPSLYTMGGIQYVSAVTSWGDKPCRTYSINTAVQDHYDWIISIAPEVAEQYKEICDNGLDDDGNGKVDAQDPACIFCGNNIVNIGEECDGAHFSGDRTTCDAWDSTLYSGGNVSCNEDCTVNYDNCKPVEFCGDGKLSDTEECDGSLFVNDIKTCADLDGLYTSGNLKCTKDCKIDVSSCKAEAKCGDGIVNGDELCDGTKFFHNRTACNTIYPDLYSSGKVKCNSECKYDVSDCVAWCGNGSLNKKVGEICDGDKFGGETCETLVGPGSKGTLKCIHGCTLIDVSACSKPSECGDGIVNPGEECDKTTIPGGKTKCSDYDASYAKGEVSCNANCTLNYSLCETGPVCGNDKVDEGESCDGTKFANNRYACKTLFPDLYSDGQVTCKNNCEYDTSACVAICGNGSVNTTKGEVCDHGKDVDKFTTSTNTCEKVVGKGSVGTLICADDCKSIITTGCSEPAFCGDNIVNNSETCDGTAFLGNKKACADWDSKYASGNVKCTAKCGLDYSDCVLAPVCGDQTVNGTEQCDGLDFKDNKTMCSDWDSKYASGRVKCSSKCTIDDSNCLAEVVTPDEICDNKIDDSGNGLIDCDDPACASDNACKAKSECGNGIVDGTEECDGTAFLLNEDRCSEWILSFKSGKVTCNANCTINYDNCSTLAAEICDNKIDDNGNDRTDCDDYDCVDFEGCQAATDPTAEDPTIPTQPEDPENPTQPEDPENPTQPEDPENPTQPENPENPTQPENPENPTQPGNSENPTQPGNPETPAQPDNPEQPAQENGGHSGGSDCSSTPLSNGHTPLWAMLLGLMGLGATARRRRTH